MKICSNCPRPLRSNEKVLCPACESIESHKRKRVFSIGLFIIGLLLFLVSLSITSTSHGAVTDGYSDITCKATGFAIHQNHLQVFVNIVIDQDVHFAIPFRKISDVIIKEITGYRFEKGLERFTDENTSITILKVTLH
ncbi:MAG: hypothetical protein ACTSX1_15705 [Candidatus Heimdallarchaeaceae archaeon]